MMNLLRADPIVKSVKRRTEFIIVRYITGIQEKFCIQFGKLLIPDDPFKGNDLTIKYEVPFTDSEKLNSDLMMISYKDFIKGSYLEQHLIIQRYIKHILDNGLVPNYPQEYLIKDLRYISESKLSKHEHKNSLLLYGHYGWKKFHPGHVLIEGLTSWVKSFDVRSVVLNRAIRTLLKRKKDVTVHNIACEMSTRHRFISPNAYLAVLNQLNISNLIVGDPQIDHGSKQIAFSLMNCVYHTNSQHPKLTSFIGSNCELFNLDHYDLIFVDYDFREGTQVQDLEKWLNLGDSVLIYVPNTIKHLMPKPYKSTKIITEFRNRESRTNPNFFYYYV